jgi:uncharacterized protein (TIGR03435 family)
MRFSLAGALLIVSWAGCLHAQAPEFEAASVKPSKAGGGRGSMNSDTGRITYTNVSLRDCLMAAYDAKDYQVSGPDWIRSERYDIVATAPGTVSDDVMKLMLQKLLTERFQMTIHREKRDLPVYALVAGKNGTKLHETETPGRGNLRMNGGGVVFTSTTVAELIDYMSRLRTAEMDRPVIDNTGLKGKYDFTINLFGTQEEMMAAINKGDFGSSIFTLIQEQLGLKLEPQKLPLDMVVVDKAERVPTEN